MNRNLFAVLLLAATSEAWAQQGITRLQCDGNFSNFVQNIRDVEVRGGYVEIRKDSVRVLSIVGFSSPEGTTYRISREYEANVSFVHPTDELYYGSLNRLSGRLQLFHLAEKSGNKLSQIFYGDCRTAKPLF